MHDIIFQLFAKNGHSDYGSEPVNQLEHALQAAFIAERQFEEDYFVLACLLHDIGHILHEFPDNAPTFGVDDFHENLGNEFLKRLFPLFITEPIRLHVEAKRYLCGKNSEYFEILSEASKTSLNLQGGKMNSSEISKFEKNPFFIDAIKLRLIDDKAKIKGLKTKKIDDYLPLFLKYIKND